MKNCWKLRLNSLVVLLFISCSTSLFGQYDKVEDGYFKFPIQPERTNYLAGNMGELRASHFHAGLDIKTNGVEGLNVYAAAEGYVSRIAVSTGGYGNCVYVAHPNGTTTVYAHLQSFNEELAKYVLENQYQQKSFTINLFPERNQFKLKQGEILGFSGNSGSSTGPHLHFEIRNVQQQVLDPLRFGFSQIKDQIAPIAERIALKTMNIDARVNGEFGRFEFNLERRGNEYVIADTILATGKLGIELWAHDKLDGAANKNGIPFIDVFENDQLLFRQRIDTVSFALQNNIKVHTNYQAEQETKRRYNKLYVDDGNTLGFYQKLKNNGFFYAKADSIYNFKILLADAYNNERLVSFVVKGVDSSKVTTTTGLSENHSYILDNTLQLKKKKEGDAHKITLYTAEGSRIIDPAYQSSLDNIYLIDLSKGVPSKIDYGHGMEDLNLVNSIPSGVLYDFSDASFTIQFNKNSLFDTLYLEATHQLTENGKSEILKLGPSPIPLKSGISIELSPLAEYDSLESYQVYSLSSNGKPSYVGGEWVNGKIRFSTSSLDSFTLLKDEVSPTIQLKPTANDKVAFLIDDAMSGIANYEATMNGEWVLMHYDPKKKLIWSELLDKSKPISGDFALVVTDNAGNKKSLNLKL
uniref:M23 family metallopeptidase n=1 Tax=Roseivirga sp. TaxID=1964215 RepID=UPI004047776F